MISKINFERIAGYSPVFLLLIYILLYGIFIAKGFTLGTFKISYVAIIIPIFVVDGLKGFIESFSRISFKDGDEDLSKVTVIIACKDGEAVLGDTINDLLRRFDAHQIIIASNGSTDGTCAVALSLGVRCYEYSQPLGKVRAINTVLKYVDTPFVLLLDDDTLVGDAKIPTGLLEQGYEGVAFRVLVKVSTWVTKYQQYEYRKSSDIGKRFQNKRASVHNISGAIGLFTAGHLRTQISRHTGEFSGEDLQRTLLIHLTSRAKGVVLAQSIVYTAPPDTFRLLFRQRVIGWYPGLYANFKNYFKILTRDKMPYTLRIDAFYNIVFLMLFDVLRALSLPILIFYPWYFAVMYVTYLLFDLTAYIRSYKTTSVWVYLLFPMYGLLNFITRLCAFAVFVYRRVVVKLEKRHFLDDYRIADSDTKIFAVFSAGVVVVSPLLLNIEFNYLPFIARIFTFHF